MQAMSNVKLCCEVKHLLDAIAIEMLKKNAWEVIWILTLLLEEGGGSVVLFLEAWVSFHVAFHFVEKSFHPRENYLKISPYEKMKFLYNFFI